jgi:hypothetical protein
VNFFGGADGNAQTLLEAVGIHWSDDNAAGTKKAIGGAGVSRRLGRKSDEQEITLAWLRGEPQLNQAFGQAHPIGGVFRDHASDMFLIGQRCEAAASKRLKFSR